MLNTKALKIVILQKDCSINELARLCSLTRETMSRRVNGHSYFTLREIDIISERLGLSTKEKIQIFFA